MRSLISPVIATIFMEHFKKETKQRKENRKSGFVT